MQPRKVRFGLPPAGRPARHVIEALQAAGWEETGGPDWSLWWETTIPGESVCREAGSRRRMNHLYGIGAVNVKDRLHGALAAARVRLQPLQRDGIYAFAPSTYALPEQFAAWRGEALWYPHRVWIRKPKIGARGEGVALVERVRDLEPDTDAVLQRYIDRPHLLDDRKYTLRCYVLITSLDPLVVYLYDDGFVKLASRPYTADPAARGDRFVHLTNPDVLRDDTSQPVSARNLTHRQYRERMAAGGVDVDGLWARIRGLVSATMMAVRDDMVAAAEGATISHVGAFELLGFDVTLDADLNPYLLECNVSPALEVAAAADTAASRDEADLKRALVADLLRLTGIADHLPVPTAEEPIDTKLRGEDARRGGFTRVVPAADVLPILGGYARLGSAELAAIRTGADPDGDRLVGVPSALAAWWPIGDSLALYFAPTRALYRLDAATSYTWLAAADHLSARQIGGEIAAATGIDPATAVGDAWNALATWHREGLLRPVAEGPGEPPHEPARAEPTARLYWNRERLYSVLGIRILVRYPDRPIEAFVHPVLALEEAPGEDFADASIDIIGEHRFELRHADGRVTPAGAHAELPAAVHRELLSIALHSRGAAAMVRADLCERGGRTLVLVDDRSTRARELRRALTGNGWAVAAGASLLIDDEGLHAWQQGGTRTIHAPVVSYLTHRLTDGSTLRPLDQATALERLVASDIALAPIATAAQAAVVVAWAARTPAFELAARTVSEAVALLETQTTIS